MNVTEGKKPCPTGTNLVFWLLGAGFILSVVMAYVAGANFKVVENLRNSEQVFESVPEGETRRMALRYVASELNRHFFFLYGYVHTGVFGAALVIFLLARLKSYTALFGLVYCVALSLTYIFYFTPVLEELGREIDFLPRDPMPEKVDVFYAIHTVDVVLEMIKLLWIPVMCVMIGKAARKSE